jgi:hypothetical protein
LTGGDGGSSGGSGGGGRPLAFHQEALRAALVEAATATGLYHAALEGGGNKKERAQLKRRVATAEKRKLKLMRKVAAMEQGSGGDGDEGDIGGGDDEGEVGGDDAELAGFCAVDEAAEAKRPRVEAEDAL